MHLSILNKLCCPTCKRQLKPVFFSAWSDEIMIDGVLLCPDCKKWFPVISYVPVMLVFKTSIHTLFAQKYTERLSAFSDYQVVDGTANPGELSVQETFSEEWDIKEVGESELSFAYTTDELVSLNRDVFIRKVASVFPSIKSLLEIGCGIGIETVALGEIFNQAEIYAVDLNFALLKSGFFFRDKLNRHLVIASLFALPFPESSFDFVYSEGVVHHTFSTRKALEAISAYVGRNGYLFIWIYALEDHLVLGGILGFLNRLLYRIEMIFRPLISRLGQGQRKIFFKIVSLLAHPLEKMRARHKDKWTLEDTNHGLRDLFSPRFAHRSGYNEAVEWFESLAFDLVDIQSPEAYRKLFNKRIHGIGLTGQKRSGKFNFEDSSLNVPSNDQCAE